MVVKRKLVRHSRKKAVAAHDLRQFFPASSPITAGRIGTNELPYNWQDDPNAQIHMLDYDEGEFTFDHEKLRVWNPLTQEYIKVPEAKLKPKKARKKKIPTLSAEETTPKCNNCGKSYTHSFKEVANTDWRCDIDGFEHTCLNCAAKQILNNQDLYKEYPDELFIQIRKFFHDRTRVETGFTASKPHRRNTRTHAAKPT